MSALAAAIASRAPSLGRGSIRWLNFALLGLVAAVGVAAYVVVESKPAATSTTIQQTSTVTRGVVLSSVSATGSIVAANELSLNFQNGGTLTEVDVKATEHVTKGQVLGKIDSTDAAASVRQAEAALSSARANLQTTLTGETAAQRKQDTISLTQAKVQIATAKAALASAKTTAVTDAKTARASLAQARQQLRADQANEAVAVAQKKTDLGAYANLAAVQAAETAAQTTVAADQTQQHDDQQAQYDLQLQQTQWNQQLASDKAKQSDALSNGETATAALYASKASSDQSALDSLQVQLQNLSKTLANEAYQLSQDQTALSTIQSTVNAIKADQSSIDGYQTKIVSDRNSIETATTSLASTIARDKQSIQSAKQSLASAKLSVKSSELGVAIKQATPTESTLAQLRNAIVQGETGLTAAQRTLAQTTLRAPLGGTVASVVGIIGQTVAGGGLSSVSSNSSSSASASSPSAGFVTLIGLSSLEVTASFAESDVAKLAIGDPATVTVSALGSTKLAAHIASIDSTSTSTSGVVQYTVTFALDRTSTKLKAGMTATIAVTVAEKDNVLHVPSAAVTGSGQNARVTVLKNGKTKSVGVVAGLKGDSSTEIVSGLTAGQTLVTTTAVASSSTSPTGTGNTPARPSFGGGGFGGGGFGGPPGG